MDALNSKIASTLALVKERKIADSSKQKYINEIGEMRGSSDMLKIKTELSRLDDIQRLATIEEAPPIIMQGEDSIRVQVMPDPAVDAEAKALRASYSELLLGLITVLRAPGLPAVAIPVGLTAANGGILVPGPDWKDTQFTQPEIAAMSSTPGAGYFLQKLVDEKKFPAILPGNPSAGQIDVNATTAHINAAIQHVINEEKKAITIASAAALAEYKAEAETLRGVLGKLLGGIVDKLRDNGVPVGKDAVNAWKTESEVNASGVAIDYKSFTAGVTNADCFLKKLVSDYKYPGIGDTFDGDSVVNAVEPKLKKMYDEVILLRQQYSDLLIVMRNTININDGQGLSGNNPYTDADIKSIKCGDFITTLTSNDPMVRPLSKYFKHHADTVDHKNYIEEYLNYAKLHDLFYMFKGSVLTYLAKHPHMDPSDANNFFESGMFVDANIKRVEVNVLDNKFTSVNCRDDLYFIFYFLTKGWRRAPPLSILSQFEKLEMSEDIMDFLTNSFNGSDFFDIKKKYTNSDNCTYVQTGLRIGKKLYSDVNTDDLCRLMQFITYMFTIVIKH